MASYIGIPNAEIPPFAGILRFVDRPCAEDLLHGRQMLGTSPSMTEEELADFASNLGNPAKGGIS